MIFPVEVMDYVSQLDKLWDEVIASHQFKEDKRQNKLQMNEQLEQLTTVISIYIEISKKLSMIATPNFLKQEHSMFTMAFEQFIQSTQDLLNSNNVENFLNGIEHRKLANEKAFDAILNISRKIEKLLV